MLTFFLNWFKSPQFPEDEDKTRSALLLNVVLNTFIITFPIIFMGAILGGDVPRLEIILIIIACAWVLILGLRFIMLAGHVILAGIGLITIIFTTVTLAIYNIGTVRAPATSFYILTIVMSGLIINRRAIFWMAGMSTITVIIFVLAEKNGLLPEPSLAITITQGITFAVIFAIISVLLYLAVKNIDEALARARQELDERQRAETRFRGLLEFAPDAMVVVNSNGTIILANSQLQNIFGYTSEEVLGNPIEMLIPKRFADIHLSHSKQYGMNQRVRPIGAKLSLYALRKDGTEFPVEISLSPMVSNEDDLVIAAIRDITDRINANKERERYIEELNNQNAELERFTYTVSHDLKSPLVTIKGFLGMLKKDVEENKQDRVQKDFERIAEAAEKMGTLLSELLDLTKVGRIVPPSEKIDLVKLAQEALETLDAPIHSRKVTVKISPDLPTVYGDRTRLREVFENLIDNAAKYMGEKPDPLIKIGSRYENSQQVIFVKDNGIGIESRYHTKIFELFEKLDPNSEGTGIGLALIKRIIETHGGKIWVESEGLGKGSTFFFTIPDNKKMDR